MTVILGVDAAWTERQPSGVALLSSRGDRWKSIAVAPSCESFLDLAAGAPLDWSHRFHGGPVTVGDLLAAAEALAGTPVDVAALDIPLSRVAIQGRREADRAVSRFFGRQGCSTHSPNGVRPGPISEQWRSGFEAAGFELITEPLRSRSGCPRLIEVYPHPALLHLLRQDFRLPYKVSKSGKYWPGASVTERIGRLLREMGGIHSALEDRLGPLPLAVPTDPAQVPNLSHLKRYEDAIDALVCAWVGAEFCSGRATSYGDASAAIWIPSDPPA